MSYRGTVPPPQWTREEEIDFATQAPRVYYSGRIWVESEYCREPSARFKALFSIDESLIRAMTDEELATELTPRILEAVRAVARMVSEEPTMSSTLDDARESLWQSTKGWLRYQWSEVPWFQLVASALAFMSVIALAVFSIPPLCFCGGWFVRHKARKECERHGVDWRKA